MGDRETERLILALRRSALRSALGAFQPDVLIVDHAPRGALGELEPALQYLRDHGRTRCVLGLRDVLEHPETLRREWDAANNEAAIPGVITRARAVVKGRANARPMLGRARRFTA